MNSRTTVTELLSNGAFIEGANGESLSELLSVGNNSEWLHDLPVSKLIERNAIIGLPNGINISRKGSRVLITSSEKRKTLGVFANSSEVFSQLSDIIDVSISPINTADIYPVEMAEYA